jgi:hypothetical protein
MRVVSLVATVVQTAVVLAATGAFGFVAHQPWLFPSLGPTAVLQATPSEGRHAHPRSALVGHACGVICGCLSVLVVGARDAPGVIASGHLSVPRLAAAVIALASTTTAMVLLRSLHAPAAATTLLFAEGSYEVNARDVLLVLAGIALTVSMGEVLWIGRRALGKACAWTEDANHRARR